MRADDQDHVGISTYVQYQSAKPKICMYLSRYYIYEFTFRSYPHQKQRTTTCCFIQLQLSVSSYEDDLEGAFRDDRPTWKFFFFFSSASFGEVRRTEERQAFGFK